MLSNAKWGVLNTCLGQFVGGRFVDIRFYLAFERCIGYASYLVTAGLWGKMTGLWGKLKK